MRIDEIVRCVNCGVRPLPFKQEGKYRYQLIHNEPLCPAAFGYETHQHTRDACIKTWNQHQAQFNNVS